MLPKHSVITRYSSCDGLEFKIRQRLCGWSEVFEHQKHALFLRKFLWVQEMFKVMTRTAGANMVLLRLNFIHTDDQ